MHKNLYKLAQIPSKSLWLSSPVNSAGIANEASYTWTSIFDNTKWELGDYFEAEYGLWNGSAWESETRAGYLKTLNISPIDGWEIDYRPNVMRITCTGGNSTITNDLRDTNGDLITSGYYLISGSIIELTFGDYDIGNFLPTVSGLFSFVITNIEFGVLS
jgi:hypothetical protein